MLNSGTTGISTTSDSAVTLIANAGSERIHEVTVVNEGSVPGFISIDGGTNWVRMPAGPSSRTFRLPDLSPITAVVKAKRIAGGSDMSGLYADAT